MQKSNREIPLFFSCLVKGLLFFAISGLFPLFSFDLFSFSKRAVEEQALFEEAIGVRTYEFLDAKRKRPVLVEVWYPTDQEGVLEEANDPIWLHPKEMRNAPLFTNGEKFPLILMSHGHRGDRRDRSWLAERLVKNGYIVASVEHFGDTRHNNIPGIGFCFWERPKDVSFALEELMKGEISSHIDVNRIGFVGYSLGGMTGLYLAGAKAKNVKEAVLKRKEEIREIPIEKIEAFDFSEAEKSFKEPKIRSFLLLCPAIFVFPPEGLKSIDAPIGLIAAMSDEVLPHKEHAYQLIRYVIVKKLKLMRKGVSHYAFLNRVSEKGKQLIKSSLHKDLPSYDRKKVHQEAAEFAIEFFKETLP